jgi:hypothetical protein
MRRTPDGGGGNRAGMEKEFQWVVVDGSVSLVFRSVFISIRLPVERERNYDN